MDHSQLPSVATAALPARYEAAKIALAECGKIDECKDWGDKAKALASYAKQSQDKEMEKTAMRIRARAVRRCGELLKEVEKASGKSNRFAKVKKAGGGLFYSRETEAGKAGISPRQAKDAIRVSNVPQSSFDEQIESDDPPTITKLAEQGVKKRKEPTKPIYERLGMAKHEFQAGIVFPG